MAASAAPMTDRRVRLEDGRAVAYCEWGRPDGRPVVLLHGWQGSRLFCPDTEATDEAAVRLVTVDRPGFGRSDPKPGRTLLDWTEDYAQLLAALDVPRAAIVGWSGGGPYALAAAVATPELVTGIGLAASDGPWTEVPGALDAVSVEARDLIELLHRDPETATHRVEERCAWYGEDWERMFAAVGTLADDSDDRLMSDPVVLEPMKIWMREGARQGSVGYASDWIAECGPWGFDLADVEVPTHVWWGEADRLVDRAHTDYLAASIPGAVLRTYPGEGHLFPLNHWAEMLSDLATRS